MQIPPREIFLKSVTSVTSCQRRKPLQVFPIISLHTLVPIYTRECNVLLIRITFLTDLNVNSIFPFPTKSSEIIYIIGKLERKSLALVIVSQHVPSPSASHTTAKTLLFIVNFGTYEC